MKLTKVIKRSLAYCKEKMKNRTTCISVCLGVVLFALILVSCIYGIKLGKMPETPINGNGVTENANSENEITGDEAGEVGDPTEISGELSVNEADSDYDKDAFVIDEDNDTIPKESSDAGEQYINDTLFIGDSNTVRMMNYGYTSLENTIALVGMGIQSVKTLQCVEFAGYSAPVTMVEAVKLMQPRRIIITFGTNNANGMDTDTFIKKYEEALDALHDAYPYADIIINSVPPFSKENKYPTLSIKSVDQFNVALLDMAKRRGLKFLNTSSVMKDEATGYAKKGYTVSDGIHISEDGFNAMFGYIRTHSHETEDTRPKPLKAIPKQNKNTYVMTGGQLKSDPKSYDQMSVDPNATGDKTVTVPEPVAPTVDTCKHASYRENVVKQATEYEEGKMEYICNDCGYKTYSVIPKIKHEHKYNRVDSKCKASTETEKGYEFYQCSCGDSYTKDIPMLPKKEVTPPPVVDPVVPGSSSETPTTPETPTDPNPGQESSSEQETPSEPTPQPETPAETNPETSQPEQTPSDGGGETQPQNEE